MARPDVIHLEVEDRAGMGEGRLFRCRQHQPHAAAFQEPHSVGLEQELEAEHVTVEGDGPGMSRAVRAICPSCARPGEPSGSIMPLLRGLWRIVGADDRNVEEEVISALAREDVGGHTLGACVPRQSCSPRFFCLPPHRAQADSAKADSASSAKAKPEAPARGVQPHLHESRRIRPRPAEGRRHLFGGAQFHGRGAQLQAAGPGNPEARHSKGHDGAAQREWRQSFLVTPRADGEYDIRVRGCETWRSGDAPAQGKAKN